MAGNDILLAGLRHTHSLGRDGCLILADEIDRLNTALADRDATVERLTRELEVERTRSAHRKECWEKETRAAEAAERERDAQKQRGDNHAETLRGVRKWIQSGDIERALLWISDGLSGYTETAEKYLADEVEKREAAERDLAEARAEVERLDKLLDEAEDAMDRARSELLLVSQDPKYARNVAKDDRMCVDAATCILNAAIHEIEHAARAKGGADGDA